MKNLLRNPKFLTAASSQPHLVRCFTPLNPDGQVYYDTEAYGNLTRPDGWNLWCIHAREFEPPWDPDNTEGYVVPEVKRTEVKPDGTPQYPDRWHEGARSLVFFNRERISRGGLWQIVNTVPGHIYTLGGWGQGWNANNEWDGNPNCSWGAGCNPFAMLVEEIKNTYAGQERAALLSLQFRVGIDPTGETTPFADSAEWGPWIAIYNAWHEIPEVSVEATGNQATAFVEVTNLWRTQMNDRYFTDFWMVDNDEDEDPAPPPVVGDYDYPVVASGPKLHPHGNDASGTDDVLRYMVEQGHPLPFCKIVLPEPKNWVAVHNLKQISPQTRFIVRAMQPWSGDINVEGPDFYGSAQAYMDSLKGYFDALGDDVWAWELWNEQDPPGEDGHVQMAKFAIECMKIADEWGIRLALMSYSTGVPENSEWQAIWDRTSFFQTAKAGGHILSLHAYCRSIYPEELKAHLLRPLWLYENILEPNNCVIPFVFTEYGVTEVDGGGIWDNPEYPTVESLMAEYVIVDELLGSLYYCLGGSVFTFGVGWTRYKHDTIWRAFADTLLTLRDVENALPPQEPVEPPPDDEIVPPREIYERTYVLMSPQANSDWVKAVLDASWDTRRWTIGGSADDAGFGLKNYRTVIAVNPAEWGDSLSEFFERDYPGIKYIPVEAATPNELRQQISALIGGGAVPKIAPFRQCDAPWGGVKMAPSSLTMCQAGCAVTAATSEASFVKPDITPLEMVNWLRNNNGFLSDGRLILTKPAEFVDGMSFYGYTTWRKPGMVADLPKIRDNLKHGPVIVQVDYDPSDADLDSHFVVLTEDLGDDFTMMDPWTGTFGSLMDRYGRASLEQSIFALLDYRFDDVVPPPAPSPTPPPSPVPEVRGVHWAPIYNMPVDIGTQVDRLTQHGIKFVKLLHNGADRRMVDFAAALLDEGITPVIRIYHAGAGRNAALESAKEMIEVGADFFEGHNEINIEWPNINWQNQSDIAKVGEVVYLDAKSVIQWGGKASLPAWAPTDRGAVNHIVSGVMFHRRLLDYLLSNHKSEVTDWLQSKRLWLAVHVAPFNKPLAFNPRRTAYVDDFCLRYYEVAMQEDKDRFGVPPLTMATEAGPYSSKHMKDLTFPVQDGWVVSDSGERLYDLDSWGEYTERTYEYLEKNSGIPIMIWTFTDEGVQDPRWLGCGWYDANGNQRIVF